jgi:hypothetical protein
MPGRFISVKEKPKVQFLRPSSGGVLRSQEGGEYVPVTPRRHFSKPRSEPHILQPIDKARKRFLQKVRKNILIKPAPTPIVPFRHKVPEPARVVTYDQLKERAEAELQRERVIKQQHIRQKLIRLLASAKQSKRKQLGVLSVICGLPVHRGARVPCYKRYPFVDCPVFGSEEDTVCSPEVVGD